MRLLVLVDATEELLIVWAGVGFKRKCGSWSSSYLIGRSLLAATDLTIPRDELEALVAGSNMLWILRQILSGWTDTFLLAGDARIPLYWVLSDKKRLGLWHRTRSVQIRRGTPLENLFHVKTEFNVADGPNRPEKLDLSVDLGPGSKWEVGLPWMTKDLEDIVSEGILTPVSQLTLRDEEKKEYDEGFVIERSPDILTRGHLLTPSHSCNRTPQNRVDLVASRARFSSYLLLPTKFSFDKSVRIMAIVYKFCEAFKKKWQKGYSVKQQPPTRKFQVLLAPLSGEVICKDSSSDSNLCEDKLCQLPLTALMSAMSSYYRSREKICVRLQEEELNGALSYFYLTATREVEEFNKSDHIARIAVKRDDILFLKSRILEGQRFLKAGGFENMEILNSQGINTLTPVIDR